MHSRRLQGNVSAARKLAGDKAYIAFLTAERSIQQAVKIVPARVPRIP